MPASGDDDSPMANRGCRPRSRSATRSPSRRATIARIEPPKPEPTMARSTSGTGAPHRRRHRCSRFICASRAARDLRARCSRRAARCPRDRRRPVDRAPRPSPERCAEGGPPSRERLLHDPLEIAQAEARARVDRQRVDGAVAAAGGNHGADGGAARPRPSDRAERPFRGLVMRHERRIEQDEHPQRDAGAQERGGLGERPRASCAC